MAKVVLVDKNDVELGAMEKIEAHKKGVLHRAFSLLVFNSKGELMLQKRAANKYHSHSLWTNTCCSHPSPNESIYDAAKRRAMEEMGITCNPKIHFRFIYKIALENEITEHELDYVLSAISDNNVVINISEVQDWKFMCLEDVKKDIANNPHSYTYWFKEILAHPDFQQIEKAIITH